MLEVLFFGPMKTNLESPLDASESVAGTAPAPYSMNARCEGPAIVKCAKKVNAATAVAVDHMVVQDVILVANPHVESTGMNELELVYAEAL